jgi:hypothetical protein
MSSTVTASDVQSDRLVGQVKWFNIKAGYGFITVNDGEHSGKDIFVHFSAVRTSNTQYKYLVQGEYVEFCLMKSATEDHEYQAVDISGIKGGPLMCETRRTNYISNGSGKAGDSGPRYNNKRRFKSQDESQSVLNRPVDDGYQVVRKKRVNAPRGPSTKATASVPVAVAAE